MVYEPCPGGRHEEVRQRRRDGAKGKESEAGNQLECGVFFEAREGIGALGEICYCSMLRGTSRTMSRRRFFHGAGVFHALSNRSLFPRPVEARKSGRTRSRSAGTSRLRLSSRRADRACRGFLRLGQEQNLRTWLSRAFLDAFPCSRKPGRKRPKCHEQAGKCKDKGCDFNNALGLGFDSHVRCLTFTIAGCHRQTPDRWRDLDEVACRSFSYPRNRENPLARPIEISVGCIRPTFHWSIRSSRPPELPQTSFLVLACQ
jgi:hypothetical protein